MAGMAEMAQMAAILKYNRQGQCKKHGDKIRDSQINAMKNSDSNLYKEKSADEFKWYGWRDLIADLGSKTKCLYTHGKQI